MSSGTNFAWALRFKKCFACHHIFFIYENLVQQQHFLCIWKRTLKHFAGIILLRWFNFFLEKKKKKICFGRKTNYVQNNAITRNPEFVIIVCASVTEKNMKRKMRSGAGNTRSTLMRGETAHLVSTVLTALRVLGVTRAQGAPSVNIVIVAKRQGWNQQRNHHLVHQPITLQIISHHLVINM